MAITNNSVWIIILFIISKQIHGMTGVEHTNAYDACRSEVQITEEEIIAAGILEAELNENSLCYISCILRKVKVIENYKVNVPFMLAAFKDQLSKNEMDTANYIFNLCAFNVVITDACDGPVKFLRCCQYAMLRTKSLSKLLQ
ncbi:uncharacterized protein LOC119669915 [Teleopsis dalmanni]|uniref:uncharacterized protein LOC119669915 n=1 Tax=Teleopsis dalmanni TaxID=139649 RepID=UPI0018CF8D30|nr:uncharacterized protein LOC119669915 [Teleopsis dalmanni]